MKCSFKKTQITLQSHFFSFIENTHSCWATLRAKKIAIETNTHWPCTLQWVLGWAASVCSLVRPLGGCAEERARADTFKRWQRALRHAPLTGGRWIHWSSQRVLLSRPPPVTENAALIVTPFRPPSSASHSSQRVHWARERNTPRDWISDTIRNLFENKASFQIYSMTLRI